MRARFRQRRRDLLRTIPARIRGHPGRSVLTGQDAYRWGDHRRFRQLGESVTDALHAHWTDSGVHWWGIIPRIPSSLCLEPSARPAVGQVSRRPAQPLHFARSRLRAVGATCEPGNDIDDASSECRSGLASARLSRIVSAWLLFSRLHDQAHLHAAGRHGPRRDGRQ
ncbi:uncharacterized protein B0H18DRAFT_438204 [Fomitopsis serialis]|uniref:uncharacterized protein n=1 Tax=Fomitopsis serialis TaxID=139415 RepID=UPI0020084694|nr:uncharacterized protein B0H18DRAFT_438204 [Neoantrodia serialis]KAH9924196.1 hypothetical protein B0H18DRAFT_438204 [Neoantrodia serialis]